MANVAEDGFTNAGINPEAANAAIADLLSDKVELPTIAVPSDNVVTLPGGLLRPDGSLIKNVLVRELTGESEEAIARAAQSGNPARILATYLEQGTERIGDDIATRSLLKELLVGDRETILLGIRRVTYGDKIELKAQCSGCGEILDLEVTLDDVPIKTLDNPQQAVYEVPLRNGRLAKVALSNGYSQEEVLEHPSLSIAEQNTLLLSKTVKQIVEADGTSETVIGTGPVRRLGSADRRTILDFLSENQPGPQYDEMKFEHETCGKESALPFGLSDLFRD